MTFSAANAAGPGRRQGGDFGERVEAIYVELDRDRMSQFGISRSGMSTSRQKNLVADAGRVQVGSEFIVI